MLSLIHRLSRLFRRLPLFSLLPRLPRLPLLVARLDTAWGPGGLDTAWGPRGVRMSQIVAANLLLRAYINQDKEGFFNAAAQGKPAVL